MPRYVAMITESGDNISEESKEYPEVVHASSEISAFKRIAKKYQNTADKHYFVSWPRSQEDITKDSEISPTDERKALLTLFKMREKEELLKRQGNKKKKEEKELRKRAGLGGNFGVDYEQAVKDDPYIKKLYPELRRVKLKRPRLPSP